MITKQLKIEILNRFPNVYLNFLTDNIYKDEQYVQSLFSKDETVKSFTNLMATYFTCIENFYRKNPHGTYGEELEYVASNKQLTESIQKYVQIRGDKSLVRFLQVYSYCIQELSGILYKAKYELKTEVLESFFSQTYRNSIEMFRRVEKDIAEGNYWWLKNSATTLRRQLYDNFAFVNTNRFKYMCEKYLGRKMSNEDIKKEFTETINGGEKLVDELDANMEKQFNAVPYFCWVEIVDGKKKIQISSSRPQKGVYFYVAYHTKIDERSQEESKFF